MFAPPSHLQQTAGPTCWEMLSIEEALTTLEYTTELPTIENFFGIVHKCRKQRSLEYAHRVHVHIHGKGLDAHKALGNHLVPLFVECGSLSQADQIFHRITYRNEFSWTSLIQGYVGCGKFQHALDLFETMQDACIQPSICTFLALLKACSKMKWLERGRKLHADIDDMGYQNDPYIGNSLVGMYAKCGSFVEARETFDKLPVRDVVSWNALITGYVEHGLDKEALLCTKQLQAEGMSPDAITLVCSLKACGNIGVTEMNCILHTEIIQRGMDSDPVVGNALVDMYAGAGKFAEARRVLERLPSRDVISWCSLITGYIEHGFGEEALNCLHEMQQEGVPPDVLIYVCSLKACGIMGAICMGETLHMELIIEGFEGDLYVGNILVDMYAKCGCLLEAQEAFNELLPMRDIISWNTLIAAYVEHGCGEEALNCLEQMQSEGVSPDAATYVSSLKACSSIGDLAKGKELLVEIAVEGFNEDPVLINSLVGLFANCGSFAEARDLSEELQPAKDAVTWNALISGYAENDAAYEVLNCLEQMQQEGVTLDAITFVCGLKACGSIGAMDKVLQMHAEMIRYGLDKNVFAENTLVDVYAKCGFLTEARQVFECLSSRETLSWCALIAGFLEHGFAEEALKCLVQMEAEGLSPNAITYLCGLKACASMEAIDKAHEMHSNIVKRGYSRDPFVGSSLVDLYSKCGLLHEAQMVLTDLTNRDVVSCTTLMIGFAEYGFGDRALELFIEMQLEGIFPNAATFICCLKVCSNARTIDRGREFHMEAVKAGFDGDHLLANTLVDMYGKCGALEEAHKVFKHLLNPDVISWTALISGYAEHGLAQEAVIYIEQMQQEGVSPTSATFLCSIKGCAARRSIQRGRTLHAQMVRLGLEEDAFIGIALVDLYSKCGLFGDAYEMLNQLQVLDAISWTALISGYAEYGHVKEALECLREMQEVGVSPDEVSWNAVISGFSQQGESSEALVLNARMQEQGIMPNCSTLVSILEAYGDMASFENGRRVHAQSQGLKENESVMTTALIDMYSKCGSMKDAQHMFDAAAKRDCFSWTAIITAYARQGNSEFVLAMFERMKEEAIKPDDVTFLSILSACRYSGLVEKGQKYFQAMVSEHHILPTTNHQNCMVDLFCRAGQLSEAALLLQTMAGQPDMVTWSSMLSACHSWGDVNLGRQAFQCVGVLDDERNASAFVLMSNMVATADETDVKRSTFFC